MEHFAGLSYGKNTGHRILYICIKIVIFALKKRVITYHHPKPVLDNSWKHYLLDAWVKKMPWRREWLPTPVSLPGEFHAQRSLVGYRLGGGRQSQAQLRD